MINGKAYSYYGFVPIKHTGFLDMPPRVGETSYDWGDTIEPIVGEGDIFHASRDLTIDVLYDHRKTALTFREAIAELEAVPGEMDLTNIYGTQSVRLRTATLLKHPNDNFVTYRLLFNEQSPTIDRTVPSASGGAGPTIEGYSLFDDFGLLTQKVEMQDNVADLKASGMTSIHPQNGYTGYRQLRQLDIKVAAIHKAGYIGHIQNLISVLGAPGIREVVHKGTTYDCFMTDGFKVLTSKSHSTFTIRLNIAQ